MKDLFTEPPGRQSRYRRQIYRWRRTNRTSCLTSQFSEDAPVPDTQLLTISPAGGGMGGKLTFTLHEPDGSFCKEKAWKKRLLNGRAASV